jgi:GNAT superfamily N-acetyltransferase
MGILYRQSVESDAAGLLALTASAYEPIRQLGLRFPPASADIQMVTSNIARGGCYVVEDDGRLIATASISTPENVRKVIDYPSELPFLWWVATDPGCSGKGVASKFLDWVEVTVVRDQMGADGIALSTSPKHPWLVPMYLRRGYEIFHRAPEEKGGSVLMRKRLPGQATA